MPRKSRIDAAGALHHIMVRGIERRKVFGSDADRNHFLSRLGDLLRETQTKCYAWALIPNHFHLLLRTGPVPISTVMRRLLTGYAVWYNRTHGRHGHLFQNRFKSVLCQEDVYLMELVRYIHLNPIRAGIVRDMGELGLYPYSGHSVLMGKIKREWQETAGVLGFFGEKAASARRAYREYVEEGVGEGRRTDLSGGGLIRSAGGWKELKALQQGNGYQRSDERILGDGEFVVSVLAGAEEGMEKRYSLRARGYDIQKVALRVSEVLGADPGTVWRKGRYREAVEARSVLCYWAVQELGTPMSVLARMFAISIPAVSKSVARGRRIAEAKGLSLASSYQVNSVPTMIEFEPIGVIHTPFSDLTGMPIQPSGGRGVRGTVEVFEAYRRGLKDLDGFSHIILLYHFHRSHGFNLHVVPFMDSELRGLFATRAPKRPNPIGFSVVQLDRVENGVLHIQNVDILNGTPLLDIKPYVPEFDPQAEVRTGWLERARKTVSSRKSDDRFK